MVQRFASRDSVAAIWRRAGHHRHWRRAGLLVHGWPLACVQAGIVVTERPAGRKPWSRGRRATAGPSGLPGLAFIFCFRVYLPDVLGYEMSHDDRMHDLFLVFPARPTPRDGQSGSRWRSEIRNGPRSRTS
jgi:hypothetical protein